MKLGQGGKLFHFKLSVIMSSLEIFGPGKHPFHIGSPYHMTGRLIGGARDRPPCFVFLVLWLACDCLPNDFTSPLPPPTSLLTPSRLRRLCTSDPAHHPPAAHGRGGATIASPHRRPTTHHRSHRHPTSSTVAATNPPNSP
jgi:hypothetical protein